LHVCHVFHVETVLGTILDESRARSDRIPDGKALSYSTRSCCCRGSYPDSVVQLSKKGSQKSVNPSATPSRSAPRHRHHRPRLPRRIVSQKHYSVTPRQTSPSTSNSSPVLRSTRRSPVPRSELPGGPKKHGSTHPQDKQPVARTVADPAVSAVSVVSVVDVSPLRTRQVRGTAVSRRPPSDLESGPSCGFEVDVRAIVDPSFRVADSKINPAIRLNESLTHQPPRPKVPSTPLGTL
jgi:hypothetical protein